MPVYWPLRMWRWRAPLSLEGEPRADTGASPSMARLRLPRAEGEGTRSALLGGRLAVSSRGSPAATLPAQQCEVGAGAGAIFGCVPQRRRRRWRRKHYQRQYCKHKQLLLPHSPAFPPAPAHACPPFLPTSLPPPSRTCVLVLLLPLRLLLCRRCHVCLCGLCIRPLLCRAQGRQGGAGRMGHCSREGIGRQ